MKTAKNQKTKVYRRRCEELDILIYYRMLLQRISRHLSPEEVSFLMGKPLDFMTGIETFKIKSILAFDLFSMYRVLEVNSMDSMMPFGVELSSQKNLYELHVTTLADRVIYDMYKVDVEQDQKIIEFKLIDIRHDIDHYKVSTADEVEKIRIFLNEKIGAGFFNEERQPYEIHALCCVELKQYMQPKNLMLVLDELLQGSEDARIVRHQTEYGFGYVLTAHAKSTENK
ncbi:hypothetical protein OHD16_22740 [Sphingobacterium sp. ML3W]|uniref:hypothetical protein n=1 Tax=Sphingobacterium sp. ML3W TaxID=1538644 RepID=UPI00249BE08A|nr:hypothetical protein [Sphingobacterium sp. ML3W]WFA77534.1 hypothetical protein OGI71_15880 [Sphingobacterium sp. ML3W]